MSVENEDHIAAEAQADAYFDEFAGDSADAVDDAEDAKPRDGHGRFAAKADDDSLDDEQDAADDDTAADAEVAEGEQADTASDDPHAEIERLRRELQMSQHRYQSDVGRVNAYQRQIAQLQQQIAQLQQGGKKAGENPEGSGYSDAEWKALQEDFPEVAAAIEKRLNAVSTQYERQIQQLQGQLQPIQQQAHEQFLQAQYSVLEQQHPDWRDTVNTPEFHQWLQQQPPMVQQLMESENAAEAAYLLNTYKLATGASQQPNTHLQQRRQRQLKAAQTVPNRGGRQRSTIPDDDPDALFDYYASR
jgi:hypothetical protein